MIAISVFKANGLGCQCINVRCLGNLITVTPDLGLQVVDTNKKYILAISGRASLADPCQRDTEGEYQMAEAGCHVNAVRHLGECPVASSGDFSAALEEGEFGIV